MRIEINTSGSNGKNGNKGSDGATESPGKNGTHGEDGQRGGDIQLHLSASNKAKTVTAKINNKNYDLPLGDTSNLIQTQANGGNGGNGGAGGEGGRGVDGHRGSDATQYSEGTNGSDGTNGGHGGDGGSGGHGANAGNLTVTVNKNDTDLLMLLATPQLKGGSGGHGGNKGNGGRGGSGGAGGSDYSWTETVCSTYSDYEGNSQTDTSYISHHNSGGSSGSNGSNGKDGASGNNGHHGQDGLLEIKVDNQTYSNVYDLLVKSFTVAQSDDGVVEPGEQLFIEKITLANVGGMPTPPDQPIQVLLKPTEWVQPNSGMFFSESIAANRSKTLPFLSAKINENHLPLAIDTTFHASGKLMFDAVMSRVNKSFPHIPGQRFDNLHIHYPVEISTAIIPPVIARNEEVPFVIAIRNVSTKPLGMDATNPRIVQLNMQLNAAQKNMRKAVTFFNIESAQTQTLRKHIKKPIPLLMPNEIAYFSGTFQVNNETPAYTTIDLNITLNLGTLLHPKTEKKIIQQRNMHLQVAERYQFNPDADILLVTNNQTTPDIIQAWTTFANQLGTPLAIWNASLYGGLSYTQKISEQSFMDNLKEKVVVILNNPIIIDGKTTHATDYLDTMELLTAAKQNNIATYITGSQVDLQTLITPLKSVSQNDKIFPLEDKYLFWRRPKESALQKNAVRTQQQFKKAHPDQRYVPIVDFHPSKKQNSRFSLKHSWHVGTVEMRETLSPAQAHLAVRNDALTTPDQDDFYYVCKLLPFEKKLRYFDKNPTDQLCLVILYDLMEELSLFAKSKWHEGYTLDKLTSAMKNLNSFNQYSFVNGKNSNHLHFMITEYNNMTSHLPKAGDKYLLPFQRRRVRLNHLGQSICKQMLSTYFSDPNFSPDHTALKQQLRVLKQKDITARHPSLSLTRNDNIILCDNQINLSQPINKTDLPNYLEKTSHFIDTFSIFSNNEERRNAIDEQKSRCVFDKNSFNK